MLVSRWRDLPSRRRRMLTVDDYGHRVHDSRRDRRLHRDVVPGKRHGSELSSSFALFCGANMLDGPGSPQGVEVLRTLLWLIPMTKPRCPSETRSNGRIRRSKSAKLELSGLSNKYFVLAHWPVRSAARAHARPAYREDGSSPFRGSYRYCH